MDNRDLTEKFVEGSISDNECEALFAELNHNSELTDELQQNLYMEELLEQSFVEEKSAENFIANLTEKLKEENRQKKSRSGSFNKLSTGRFNKINTGKHRRPLVKAKKKKSQAPIIIFSAIAACFAVGLTIIVLNKGTSTSVASTPEVSSNLYIQDIVGTVNLNRNGKTIALKDGDFILKGDSLSASTGSTGSLYFISEKTKIVLNPESKFSIDSDVDKSEKNKAFTVNKGKVLFDVAHQIDDYNYTIKSGKADAKIIGTRLEVNSQENASTIKVYEGLVRVSSKLSGDTVDVPGNHYVNIADNSFPNIRTISGNKPKVIGFSLVNAKSDKIVKGFEILKDGIVLNRSDIPQALSIRINASNNERIHGVKTSLKDSKGKIVQFTAGNYEKILPYTMTGDTIAGDYKEWIAASGEYILEVEVFDLKKKKTDTATLTFTIR